MHTSEPLSTEHAVKVRFCSHSEKLFKQKRYFSVKLQEIIHQKRLVLMESNIQITEFSIHRDIRTISVPVNTLLFDHDEGARFLFDNEL